MGFLGEFLKDTLIFQVIYCHINILKPNNFWTSDLHGFKLLTSVGGCFVFAFLEAEVKGDAVEWTGFECCQLLFMQGFHS